MGFARLRAPTQRHILKLKTTRTQLITFWSDKGRDSVVILGPCGGEMLS